MRIFTEYFNEDKSVSITAYLLDSSCEMPNMNSRPAVLVIPGGGYGMCSDREAEPIAMLYALEGYHTFVLRYTVGRREECNYKFEQPFNDAEKAMKYIRDNAEEFGVDPNKIAAIGFSAGGHLCSALGTISKNKPNALILAYPCILAEIGDVLQCEVPSTNEYVTADTPPSFIFHANDDGLVPIKHSLEFASALAANGVEFEMHVFRNGGHGFSLATPVVCNGKFDPDASKWGEMSIKWLRKIFA
ncbi:MAG: alpha/beta hydrolase [Clostridia bacterium]|nr:alpha/beta hydrolase [Clostridia bacterium]